MNITTPLSSQAPLTQQVTSMGITTWDALVTFVQQLPYGRNANREDVSLVLKEKKGTCSSKHALLKTVANENQLHGVTLMLVLFKMNASNTPKIGAVLEKYHLDYIPEAHTILRIHGVPLDATYTGVHFNSIEKEVLWEEAITVEQVRDYKVQRHRDFLKQWIQKHQVLFSFPKLWRIREACIEALSQ